MRPRVALPLQDERRTSRDDVQYRTRATIAGSPAISVLIVNISPLGLMARSEATPAIGQRIHIKLPGLDPVAADVRWLLGGRIGCEFAVPIGIDDYAKILRSIAKG